MLEIRGRDLTAIRMQVNDAERDRGNRARCSIPLYLLGSGHRFCEYTRATTGLEALKGQNQ